MPTIHTLIEPERGCGFRKPGGKYLIGGKSSSPCCKLPFPLDSCPCCGNEIKFTRGFQWMTTRLFASLSNDCGSITLCPLAMDGLRIGLMWVGEKYYPTPLDFTRESNAIGVSKRIGTIPKDCKPGTWIALAHRKAIPAIGQLDYSGPTAVPLFTPGVFMIFRITSIDYVVTGEESDEELTQLESEGFRLVKVEREGSQHKLFSNE